MRRPVRRPRRLVVFASLVTLVAATVLTTGPVVLAAKPDAARSDVARKIADRSPTFRGTVDASRLSNHGVAAPQPELRLPVKAETRGSAAPDVSINAGPAPALYTANPLAPSAIVPGGGGFAFPQTSIELADPWIAVGPDHVLQTVNTSLQIWDRTRGVELPPTLLSVPELFALPPGFSNLHPRFVYDALHGRWVGTEVSWICDDDGGGPDISVGFLDFVVSETADPTGAWTSWFYFYDNALPDLPAAGGSTDKLAFTADLYDLPDDADCTGAPLDYLETHVLLTDWADVLAHGTLGDPGIDTPEYAFADGDGSLPAQYLPYIGAHVALQVPATSPTMHLVARHDAGAGGFGLYYSTISGSAVTNTITFGYDQDLNTTGLVGPLIDPPTPKQPSGTVPAALTSIPTDALWQNGRLTTVATVGCTPNTGVLQACVRVTQLNTPANPLLAPTKRQDFVINEKDADDYMGGIGLAGNGTLHVVWTRSAAAAIVSPAQPGEPSAQTGYQLPTDATNTLSPPVYIAKATGGAYGGTEWGGYQGVAQDPQVPNAVWQGAPYSSSGILWATNVSQLQTGGATYVPIDPLRVVDSRVPLGVTGIFTASFPRTFQVAGVGTIPAGAIAVTGNVTVTGQTAAGYVSITTTPTSTPGSSTLNFPTKDNRANNVTTPLASNGSLAAVYKAAAGKKSHVIFDVTGYFLPGATNAGYNTVGPVRVLDTREPIGLAGRFQTGTPRQLTVGGVGGIPANAVAITANLTVVGQEKAGFVSVTPTSVPNPTTSNLNFPTGDIRANGLTAKLTAGKLWLVYKATGSTTARTHLVLDVTGYYLAAGSGLKFFPLTPGRIMDTRSTLLTGLTGTFAHNASRALDTDGHWGVPAGAKAVTGNLTVVGQTKAGYVSITPTPVANPTTSTINFPLGDTRANGVTVPLNASGNMSLIYKASAGTKTHLILDVTGYFK